MEKLLQNFKYYKQEKENPFKGTDANAAMWWDGERVLFENAQSDPEYLGRLNNEFDEALAAGACSGVLVDEGIAREKRAIIFFLDIWHGKFFPYESANQIKQY